jgi:acyl carrier protein
MSKDNTEEQIREFLTSNFIFDPTVQLGLEDSFMENGVVDSTGVLEVIMWVESNFNLHVEDSEVLPENFDSIGSLMRYVESKQQGDEEAAAAEARHLALAS